jgi:hypothetical protein
VGGTGILYSSDSSGWTEWDNRFYPALDGGYGTELDWNGLGFYLSNGSLVNIYSYTPFPYYILVLPAGSTGYSLDDRAFVTISSTATPEPASAALVLTGVLVAGLGIRRRRSVK